MGNQPPYSYDPRNPYGGEQDQGEGQQSDYPTGAQGQDTSGDPPNDDADGQAGQESQSAYPSYAPETTPPPPPSYGQTAYTPPAYESPPVYQPSPYQQPGYGQSTYGQDYMPPGAPYPPQPENPPHPNPYASPYDSPYAQPPFAQPHGQEPSQPYAGQPGAGPYPSYQQGYAQPGPYPGQYQGQYSTPYGPPPYGAPYGAIYGAPIPLQDRRGGFAIASLVLGIVSLIFSCANICDMPLIVLGLIFGAMGLQSTTRRTMAVWGLVLSGISLVIAVVIVVMWVGTGHAGFSPA